MASSRMTRSATATLVTGACGILVASAVGMLAAAGPRPGAPELGHSGWWVPLMAGVYTVPLIGCSCVLALRFGWGTRSGASAHLLNAALGLVAGVLALVLTMLASPYPAMWVAAAIVLAAAVAHTLLQGLHISKGTDELDRLRWTLRPRLISSAVILTAIGLFYLELIPPDLASTLTGIPLAFMFAAFLGLEFMCVPLRTCRQCGE